MSVHPQFADYSDPELLLALKGGDQAAFEALLERYRPLIGARAARYAAYRLPGLDQEDLQQEAAIALFTASRLWQAAKGVPFPAYAERIIDNRLKDLLRHHLSQKKGSGKETLSLDQLRELGLEETVSAPEETPAPDSRMIFLEEARALKIFIQEHLSARERAVMELQMSGASYKFMAELLGTTTKGVDSALQRARRKLRSMWEGRS